MKWVKVTNPKGEYKLELKNRNTNMLNVFKVYKKTHMCSVFTVNVGLVPKEMTDFPDGSFCISINLVYDILSLVG